MTTATLQDGRNVWMVNGRLVSATLSDPAVKADLERQRQERQKDPEALRESYIRRGLLTKDGKKLSTRYGG